MGAIIFIGIVILIVTSIKGNAESNERKRNNPYIPGKTDMDEWILKDAKSINDKLKKENSRKIK